MSDEHRSKSNTAKSTGSFGRLVDRLQDGDNVQAYVPPDTLYVSLLSGPGPPNNRRSLVLASLYQIAFEQAFSTYAVRANFGR